MSNLLLSPLSKTDLISVFSRHPPRSGLPAHGDPRWTAAFSTAFAAPFLAELTRRAREEATQPLPELTDALYRDYAATGIRLHFETRYFERRRRFARAAIALLAEGGHPCPALVDSFLRKLEDLFNEESWALPAHVKNPNGRDRRELDLFGCETANLMGECLAVFAPFIPAGLQSRIRARLLGDYFENYRDGDFFWMHASHNWNAVCHQGILGAALATETDAGLLADLFLKARTLLPHFLGGYGNDGACSEGPTYWDYGFGWFTILNEQLETRTGGELSLFAGNAKIREIAGYGPAMSLLKGHLVNFADCDPKCSLRPATLAYLGLALNHAECRVQADENYSRLLSEGADYDANRSDFFYWSRFFLYAPTRTSRATPAKRDNYFSSIGIWSVRGRDEEGHIWELAAKGGHNAEHHNQNDVGSFILNVDGVPLITEIGMPEYTGAYFDPQRRYQHIAARTMGHSLPVINGREQAEGMDFRGRVLRAEQSASLAFFEIDLTRAYPQEAGCRRFIRQLTLEKETGLVRWVDSISLHKPGIVESACITDAEDVKLEEPSLAVIRKEGKTLELRGENGTRWQTLQTHAYTTHDGKAARCRRLILSADKPGPEIITSVAIKIRPEAEVLASLGAVEDRSRPVIECLGA